MGPEGLLADQKPELLADSDRGAVEVWRLLCFWRDLSDEDHLPELALWTNGWLSRLGAKVRLDCDFQWLKEVACRDARTSAPRSISSKSGVLICEYNHPKVDKWARMRWPRWNSRSNHSHP
jgi:hypothetical protein